MTNHECLQMKTGECGGCNIISIALEKSKGQHNPTELGRIAEETAEKWCPAGTIREPLVEALRQNRPSQTIW